MCTPNATSGYTLGRQVFRGIAAVWNVEELLAAMADFYGQSVFNSRSTADLKTRLYCASELEDIRAIFHRFVHGLEGEPPALDASPCG